MSDLFDTPAVPEPAKPAVQQLFVDGAGTPTLFHENGRQVLIRRGVSDDMCC